MKKILVLIGFTVFISLVSGINAVTDVTLNYPPDNANLSSGDNIDFNFTPSTNATLTAAELWANFTGTFQKNATNQSALVNGSVNTLITLSGIPEGNYIWNINISTNETDTTWASSNYTLTIDLTAPTVSLHEYTNLTKKTNSDSLTLNISVTESLTGVSACWVVIDNTTKTNQSLTYSNGWCNGTVVLTGIVDGNKTINIYANDSAGNLATLSTYVVWLDSTVPNSTINEPTNTTYTSSPIQIKVTVSDNSGISNITYKLDSDSVVTLCSSGCDVETGQLFPATGTHTLVVNTTDLHGIPEEPKIPSEKPPLKISTPGPLDFITKPLSKAVGGITTAITKTFTGIFSGIKGFFEWFLGFFRL